MPPATATPATSTPSAADAYNTLQSFDSSRETPQAATDAADTKYGVTGLASQLDQMRGLTSNLQTAIGNVAPSVQGRTSGSLVTQAQEDAITNNETKPLTDQLTKLGAQQTDLGDQYNEAQGLASSYANNLLASDNQKYQDLFGQYTNAEAQQQQAATNAFNEQQLAEKTAADKATAAAGSGATPTVGGQSSTIGNATRNAVGGYAFTDPTGKPITMGQYLDLNGGSPQMAVQLLQSGSPNDQQIAGQISKLLAAGATGSKLAALYPEVFGG